MATGQGPAGKAAARAARAEKRAATRAALAAHPPVGERHQVHECMGCGQRQVVPTLDPGMRARCVRCGTTLRRRAAGGVDRPLALYIASLGLFAVVWLTMLMRVSTSGIVHDTTLISGPMELVHQGLWPLALAVAFTSALAPLAKFVGMIYVLVPLKLGLRVPGMAPVFLFARRMGIWAMMEVLLLGVFVAFTKLGDLVTMDVGPAVYALGLLTVVTVWADQALDREAVWQGIERLGATWGTVPDEDPIGLDPHAIACEGCGLLSVPHEEHGQCPRCGSHLHARKPNSIARTWAFVMAGAILYIPANYYPVLTVVQSGAGMPSTILGGVEELLASHMYPLALLVFFASILVPIFKLIGLGIMLTVTMMAGNEQRTRFMLRQRTVLYFIVAWIGRWSMVDIFMESLLGALVQFGVIATIQPGIGAVAFCAVVLLTILAAEFFDPRLMWDAAGLNGARFKPELRDSTHGPAVSNPSPS
ncbi:paraquat-inducible protein A [Enhydrobacter aerosaccus]|uniref:Paraquat-inducible protein A n=1 Tax=Enhydrobacter aerosaccus TaxID=225324 RepID=A0A1T4SS40_9HYPH|nr:paraquat-inducible protein A [Enhydrobacter aerosaccus]SKA31074.1 paraquat-inducible protein A [Enhydrobacter aerosaccus]